ncbi:MAG TPA: hypothetical protein VHJ19_07440 [Gammaproteobacteria bacterium]|nr:hypothetical protein [Gammaproteobacteria bacterium]
MPTPEVPLRVHQRASHQQRAKHRQAGANEVESEANAQCDTVFG